MNFSNLFLRFEGRIGRGSWWLAALVLVIAAIVLTFIVYALLGVGWATAGLSTSATLGSIVVTALIAYPATAVMIKRLNDRDRPTWMAAVFWAPTVLLLLGQLLGLTVSMQDVGGIVVPAPTPLGWVINIVAFAVGVWGLIELGILRGTSGPNRHGPDPVAG